MVHATSGRNRSPADPNIGGELLDELGRFSMLPEYVMDHASHGAQALFARLRLMAGNGEAWPGVVWLAAKLGVTDRTIRRWCQELRDLGVLTVEPRFRDDGSQTSNRYRLGHARRTSESAPPDMSVRPPRTSVSALELDKGELENPPTPRERGASVPERPIRKDVVEVMEAWQSALHPRAKLTADRGRRVRSRLAEGYTVEELVEAIHGCKGSEFHREGAHTDLTLICRDAAHVDRFRALYAQQCQQSSIGARGASPAGPRMTPDQEALRDAQAWLALHPDDADAQRAVLDLQRRLGTDEPTERSTTA